MSKFMTLDKQVEEKAKKWFVRQQPEENQGLAKKWFEENKKEVIKEYLEKHPKIQKEYHDKKANLLKVKLGLGIAVTAATLAIGGVYHANSDSKENKANIEQESEIDNPIAEESTESTYKEFFEEARNIKNTNKREEFITDKTKQIIVEIYNKENPDETITADRLETLVLEENVLQKKDRVGNITYERVPQNQQYKQTETQKLVKNGSIYDFRIDGKTVAVFDTNGDILPDKNVEKQDMNFQKMIPMLKQSAKLKDIYRYPSNEQEKRAVEQSYQEMADTMLEKAEQASKEKVEIEK